MNIFCELFYSFAGVKKYPQFLKNKGGKVFLYILLVTFIYFAISYAMVIPGTKNVVDVVKELLDEYVPEFEFYDGKLHIEEDVYFEEMGVLISADSQYGSYINDYSYFEWLDALEDYEVVFMFDQETMLVKSENQLEMIDYSENLQISKQDICAFMDMAYWIVGICLFFVYIFSVSGYVLGALVVSLIGMIIVSYVKNGLLTFGQIFKWSVYVKTLPLLIKAILNLLGFGFFGYFLITLIVSSIYLGCATSYLKKMKEQESTYGNPVVY